MINKYLEEGKTLREIKFRAWDNIRNIYHYKLPDSIWLDIDGKIKNGFNQEIEENRLIIEQYTGLKDKNGKEIYEGDKVRTLYRFNRSEGVGVIEMSDGCWIVSFRKFPTRPFSPKTECYRESDYLKMFTLSTMGEVEVIGNIHKEL